MPGDDQCTLDPRCGREVQVVPNQVVLKLADISGVFCEDCLSPDFYTVKIVEFRSSRKFQPAYGRVQPELSCRTDSLAVNSNA